LLLGNLTRDPELRYLQSGTAVCQLGLAVNTARGGQGDDRKEEVCFVDVAAFGKLGETASQYLTKGRSVLVEGRLQYRSWEGQDGQKRSKHEVLAERIEFMPDGRDQGTPRAAAAAAQAPARSAPAQAAVREEGPPELEDDDIPF